MAKIGGARVWLVLPSVAVMLTLAVLPAFAGAAGASPAPTLAADSSSMQWAYGGVGYSNNTLLIGTEVLTWNASFGWTVIFTVTDMSEHTFEIEEQRTVGISLVATYSNSASGVSAKYSYHAQEVDVAFANLTNASTVYVNGSPVPALGIDNDSTSIAASIAESISVTHDGPAVTESASLDVTGIAHTSAQFTPSLGLIPLNLTGVTMWNSTSYLDPVGSWNITYTWANNGFNGETASGTKYDNGTAGTPGTVTLTGYDVTRTDPVPLFADHKPRQAILLAIEGPLGNYDLFVLVPRAFDLFGGGGHAYDAESLGTSSISAETLYVSSGVGGPDLTAAATTFGATAGAVSSLTETSGGPVSPAASVDPTATVVGAPMSVSQAQAESNCLTGGCAATASSPLGVVALAVVVGLAIVAVVGTISVIEWQSYARRRGQKGLVGGYSESWPNGVPPAAADSSAKPRMGDYPSGPSAPEDPSRRL